MIGDVWNVLDTGKNFAWDGTAWDDLSGIIDLSNIDKAKRNKLIDDKVDPTRANHRCNKTKITYDSKGLVTGGTDAAIADISGLQDALDGKASSSHAHGSVTNDGKIGTTANLIVQTGTGVY